VGVVADAEEPAAEIGSGLELVQSGEGAQKGFLSEVFGQIVAPCEVPQPAEEWVAVAFDESAEGGTIS
jgi:hypothetical protein